MPSYHIHVSARYTKIKSEIEKIIRQGIPADATVIYKARNTVYRLNVGGTDLVIKAFRVPNIINSLVYTHLRKSKAMRSYMNAKRLQELGFHTPTPIAYGEVREDGRLRQSYYISENLEEKTCATGNTTMTATHFSEPLPPISCDSIAQGYCIRISHRATYCLPATKTEPTVSIISTSTEWSSVCAHARNSCQCSARLILTQPRLYGWQHSTPCRPKKI